MTAGYGGALRAADTDRCVCGHPLAPHTHHHDRTYCTACPLDECRSWRNTTPWYVRVLRRYVRWR